MTVPLGSGRELSLIHIFAGLFGFLLVFGRRLVVFDFLGLFFFGFFLGRFGLDFRPVSYTHLDVYKRQLLGRLADVKPTKILILNKIDLIARDALLLLTKIANEKAKFDSTFMISALKGDGVADLKSWLAERMPPSPWPVSYTHLDVYKRQIRHRPCARAAR